MTVENDARPPITDCHIVLVGLMGTGKSTLGSLLASRLRRQFFDNDDVLQRQTGQTAASIQRDLGEDVLHRLEADVLLDCLAARPPAVIAAAASTVLSARVRNSLQATAFVIWLRTDLHLLAERLVNPQTRPLSDDIGVTLVRQDHDREALYASVADIVVDTTAKDAHQTIEDVIGRIAR
jgi:shikimate kinase